MGKALFSLIGQARPLPLRVPGRGARSADPAVVTPRLGLPDTTGTSPLGPVCWSQAKCGRPAAVNGLRLSLCVYRHRPGIISWSCFPVAEAGGSCRPNVRLCAGHKNLSHGPAGGGYLVPEENWNLRQATMGAYRRTTNLARPHPRAKKVRKAHASAHRCGSSQRWASRRGSAPTCTVPD